VKRRLPIDGVVVPAALLLIARELLLFAPTKELAWQLSHDARVARRSAWLGALLPRPSDALDADPVALLLSSLATALAFVYLVAAWRGARPRVRGALLGLAAAVLVALPTLAVVGLGVAMRLPYGHDGGVVQLPLAMDKVLAGESPYGADYSRSVLGRQSRASEFWAPLGGNPITRHHWYLPGVHLLMIPPYLLLRALLGFFDPRLMTLPVFFLAAWLASRLVDGPARRLTAAALVLVHPLVWWPQVFGVNDVFCAVPLLLALLLAERGRTLASAALLGLACAVKQLMWPFAPFLLVLLSGVTSWRELVSVRGLRRLAAPALTTAAVAVAIVAPVALRDWRAFVNDIFRYQVGLPGEDQYPLGGTPGFGFANFVIYFGWVRSLGDPFPFSRSYALLVPLGLLLLHRQLRRPGVAAVLLNGSLALLASLYLSRIVNPNYLTLAVIFVPLAVLRDRRLPADVAVVPLVLMLLGLEFSGRELLRTTWQAADTLGFVPGLPAWLAPGDGPRWRDPLSLVFSALAVGLAIVYLVVAWVRAGNADERTAPRGHGGHGGDLRPRTGEGRDGSAVETRADTDDATRVTAWRLRSAFVVLAALLLVALPTWLVLGGGEAARVLRAEDAFVGDVRGERPLERMDGQLVPPAPVHEAWARSFRKQGEKRYVPARQPTARTTLGRLMGGVDPRWLSLLALPLAAGLAAVRVAPALRASLAAVLLLSPLGAVGVIFGSGAALAVALLLVAAGGATARRWHARGAGIAGACAASAAALVPSTWVAWPLVAAPALGRGARGRTVAALAFAVTLAAWTLPAWLAAPPLGHVTAGAEDGAPAAVRAADGAVGLTSLLAYRGLEYAPAVMAWARVAPWIFAALGLALAWRLARHERAQPAWAAAAIALLAALWLAPGAEPHALLVPLALALLAGVET
jgi:hypothetical protein